MLTCCLLTRAFTGCNLLICGLWKRFLWNSQEHIAKGKLALDIGGKNRIGNCGGTFFLNLYFDLSDSECTEIILATPSKLRISHKCLHYFASFLFFLLFFFPPMSQHFCSGMIKSLVWDGTEGLTQLLHSLVSPKDRVADQLCKNANCKQPLKMTCGTGENRCQLICLFIFFGHYVDRHRWVVNKWK